MRGVWKGGGEDLWETWDGEGRRENVRFGGLRQRRPRAFCSGTSVRVGKVAMRGFTVP